MDLKVFLKMFLGYALLLHLQNLTLCCPTVCQVCTGRQVNCRGLGLTQIPRSFPKTTTLIYLSGNNITHIHLKEFTELQKLAVLYLDNSRISSIYPRAFDSLKKLYYLYLNDNFITLLHPGVFEGLSNLNYLHLQHNQIVFLPQGLFVHLKAVRYLSLHKNQLSLLESNVFSGMTSLSTLNLATNNISQISESAFHYLENLEHLYLEGNCLKEVPSQALSHLRNLKRLSLSNNNLGSVHNHAFEGLYSLQYLFLENADIHLIMEKSFYGLNNLKQLILSKNKLITLDSKMFNFLNHLMYLQLDRNSIVTISDNTFEEMVSLKVLNLAFNNLTFLHPKVLQPLISLTHFQATYNPWDCGCHLLDFLNVLLSSAFTFSIHCQSPLQLRGRPLRNVRRSEFENCPTSNSITEINQNLELSTAVVYTKIKIAPYTSFSVSSSENIRDVLTQTALSYDGLTDDDLLHTTDRPPLSLGTTPVNQTRETENLSPTNSVVTTSLKPSITCQHQVNSLTQSFHIILSFFIFACAGMIFLIFKVIHLKKRLVTPENQADNVLEYYSCYQTGRYELTDPSRITTNNPLQTPEIDIIRPLKQSTENQTQVILFEHSAL